MRCHTKRRGRFAVDIMYHSNCLSSYILCFKRELRQIINDQDDLDETDIDGRNLGKCNQRYKSKTPRSLHEF